MDNIENEFNDTLESENYQNQPNMMPTKFKF